MTHNGERRAPAVRVATAAVALCVMVMLVAVSIVTGFRTQIRESITGFDAHITLFPQPDPQTGVADNIVLTPALKSTLSDLPFVRNASMIATAPVLLKTPEAFKGVYLRGLPQDYDMSFLTSRSEQLAPTLTQGRPLDGLMLSAPTAKHLNVAVGDSLNIYLISDGIKARRIPVRGVFNTHFDIYDQYFAFAPLSVVQDLTDLHKDEGSALEIITNNFERVPEYTQGVAGALNNAIDEGRVHQTFNMTTTLQSGAAYFAWLDLLDTNVWVILSLMTVVAAFTLISAMLIIILERVRFIGVMKAIGANNGQIRRVFLHLAMRIGIRGMLIGYVLALAFILIQYFTHIIPLDASSYYMDFVPVSLNLWHLLGIGAAFIVVIYLVLILPSAFIARISPSESMRFEQ